MMTYKYEFVRSQQRTRRSQRRGKPLFGHRLKWLFDVRTMPTAGEMCFVHGLSSVVDTTINAVQWLMIGNRRIQTVHYLLSILMARLPSMDMCNR